MTDIIAAGSIALLLLVPVFWRAAADRAVERADIVRAEIDRTLRTALGGESLVSVEARAPGLTHPGQVILSVPAGWEELVEHSVRDVMTHVPRRYDLIIRPGERSEASVA